MSRDNEGERRGFSVGFSIDTNIKTEKTRVWFAFETKFWFAFSELMDAVEKNRIPNCIHIDELEMVLAKEQKEII